MRTGGKAIITGVSGFIGKNLAAKLISEGWHVVGVSRNAPERSAAIEGLRFRRLDVRDFAATQRLLHEEEPDVVYHLAAVSILHAAAEDGARAMLESNVAASWNVLEACRRCKTPILVMASSDKQYGALAMPPYDDEDSSAFLNGGVYELSKAQQDQSARIYAGLYDVPAIRTARFANVYGPGDTQWTRIVPGNIRRTAVGETPHITAGPAGAALREYLYIDDALRAVAGLTADAHVRGNAPLRRADGKLARIAWNVSSGYRFAAAEVIEMIQRIMRAEYGYDGFPPVTEPAPSGVFEPGHQFSSIIKLRNLIPDWAPIGLDEGLRKTIPWYLTYLAPHNVPMP